MPSVRGEDTAPHLSAIAVVNLRCPCCGHGHDRWILDLFCGAGGAAVGYHRAGFGVVGVDIAEQPHFPFTFVRADALSLLRRLIDGGWFAVGTMPEGTTIQASLSHFAAIHASPPCQFITQMSARWMDVDELREAIPPAYTEYIGAQLMESLRASQPV